MELKLEVYSPSLELLGMLEGYDSLLMETWAFKAGSFSLTTVITEKNRALLAEDYIIWFEGDTAGVIEYIHTATSEDGKSSMTVKGSLLSGLLHRRVLWGLYNLKGSPVKIMCDMVSDCAITPTRGDTQARKMYGLQLMESMPQDAREITKQKTGGELLDFLEETGRATNTAFGVAFDPTLPSMAFWARPGVDRTKHQNTVDPVFYSTELDDVLESEYAYDASQYKNLAFIAGEGEGADRKTLVVSGLSNGSGRTEPSGITRRELFIDARDLQSDSDPETPMTEEEYFKALRMRGEEKLADAQLVQSFSATVRTIDPTYVYGVDFFLGDTITVADERLGIVVDAVVEGVERSMSKSGREDLVFTFGYGLPTLSDRLRKVGV